MEIYDLSPRSISALLENVENICKKKNVEKKAAMRLQFTVEEALLKYADAYGTGCRVELLSDGFMYQNTIHVHVRCGSMNPFQSENTQGIMDSLMAGMEYTPSWRFSRGINALSFPLQKKRTLNNLERILIALVSGIALGFVARSGIIPAAVSSALVTDYIVPIANAYTGLLCVMAILMVFFTFPLSIVQTQDAETFHGMTKHILIAYLTFTLLVILLVIACCAPMLSFQLLGRDGPNVVKSGLDVILDFVPNNLVAPFLNFNCMQVLLIGLMFGCSFVAMGEKSRPLVETFDACNLAAVLTNNYLMKLIPIYVGLTAFSTIVQLDMDEIKDYMLIAYIVLFCAATLMAICAALVCIRLKVAPKVLFKKLMPAFLINLSSASVGASFVALYNEMNRDGGMDLSYCTVSCNLGTVLFKPIYTAFLSTSVLILSAMSGIAVTPAWVVLTFLLCAMLSLAIPNIPGGAASVILLLMSQMNYSDASAQLVVSMNVVMQFVVVAVDIFCLQCVSFLLAAREGKMDVEKLRKG